MIKREPELKTSIVKDKSKARKINESDPSDFSESDNESADKSVEGKPVAKIAIPSITIPHPLHHQMTRISVQGARSKSVA